MTLDSFHIFSRKTDLKAIRSIPRDKIALVQLADAPWLDMDVINWSRHFRCFPGQGDFPLTEFMDAVSATGYSGILSLEIFNDQFRAGSPRGVAVDGQRSLVYLMDQMRGRPARSPKPRRKSRRARNASASSSWNSPPTTAPAAELARLFAGLGFRKVGEHKSKAVTRWSQGAINLVLNSDKDGFAHSHQLSHGPSVCAMCLKVDDADARRSTAPRSCATRRSARRSGRASWKSRRCAGSAAACSISSIRKASSAGCGTSISRRRAQPQGNGGAGLTAIDHVSQSMHYEEMLSWLLFYNSLLDVTKTPQLDVIDPGGIVRSQVVQTADGALRIALNASQSQQTLSSRFLTHYVGSGVQHIAFATGDIVATVQQLRANGVELLSMPENYYDDLEARTDLPAERLDVLRAQQHPLRPRRGRRISAGLHPQLRGPVLLRDRRATRLQGLRRGQRLDPPGRADPRNADQQRCMTGTGDTSMNDSSADTASGKPEAGIVYVYRFRDDGTAVSLPCEQVNEALSEHGGWTWVHIGLADTRARAWIEQQAPLSNIAREALAGADEHIRLEILGSEIIGVMPDLHQMFSGPSDDIVRLRFVMTERMLITIAPHPGAFAGADPALDRRRPAFHDADRVFSMASSISSPTRCARCPTRSATSSMPPKAGC